MLPDRERFKLHFGPYRQPRYRFGDVVFCEVRGDVTIIRQTDAKIPWPIGFPVGSGRGRGRGTLVVFDALKQAVEQESAQAVSHWWGVGHGVVARWRTALGVERKNAGTSRLLKAALRDDVDRATKIAKSKEGKPRPQHVIEALRKANTGKKATPETRQRMSQTRRNRRPWQDWEDQLLREFVPTQEVVRITGRHTTSVARRKKELGLPSHRPRPFEPWEDQLLKDGVPIYKAAKLLKRNKRSIVARMEELGLRSKRSN